MKGQSMVQADLVILGAGPAGMAAAARAAGLGLSVVLLDEQARAGGQIYRDVAQASPASRAILGQDYADGLALTQALDHPNISHLTGASLWQLDPSGEVGFTRNGRAAVANCKRILLANGALERPMPIPGWTLPGVMTVGAAQVLLKSAGVVAERAVLVGSGPLLYLVAVQMLRAETPPLALIETQTPADALCSLRYLPLALFGGAGLWKGVRLLAELRRAGVRRFKAASKLEILGKTRAQALRFRSGGQSYRIACDTVLLHHGVVPNTQATQSLRLSHVWDVPQRCFRPYTDFWGRSSQKTVFIAGDGAGIGGAKAAALAGGLAALQIAHDLGKITTGDRDLIARSLRARLWLERAMRPFLDRAFPACSQAFTPADDTLICRCEEVTAGDIRRAAALGCLGPNQTKVFVRAGMGPCQGRYCGLTVTELLAAHHGISQAEAGALRIRPPLKPVTLAELAALDDAPLINAPH
jgi:NADPH-dependent 2,4-dienoyl-CoA reductase/sulfur reductase-like enzyme